MPAVVKINAAAVNASMHSPSGMVVPRVRAVTRATANIAKIRCPVGRINGGHTRSTVRDDVDTRGDLIVGRVSARGTAPLLMSGTGIFGPTGRPITPKNGRFLVFEGTGAHGPLSAGGSRGSTLVFARSVRGMPRNPFLTSALEDASPWPVRVYDRPRSGLARSGV